MKIYKKVFLKLCRISYKEIIGKYSIFSSHPLQEGKLVIEPFLPTVIII